MKISDQIISKMICEGVTIKNISIESAKKAMAGCVSEKALVKFIDDNYEAIEIKFKTLLKSYGH